MSVNGSLAPGLSRQARRARRNGEEGATEAERVPEQDDLSLAASLRMRSNYTRSDEAAAPPHPDGDVGESYESGDSRQARRRARRAGRPAEDAVDDVSTNGASQGNRFAPKLGTGSRCQLKNSPHG